MRHAAIRIVSDPPRLLTKIEAADYCARSVKRFEVECPVQPIKFPNGDLRWDRRELDHWIDCMKAGANIQSNEEIVARLA